MAEHTVNQHYADGIIDEEYLILLALQGEFHGNNLEIALVLGSKSCGRMEPSHRCTKLKALRIQYFTKSESRTEQNITRHTIPFHMQNPLKMEQFKFYLFKNRKKHYTTFFCTFSTHTWPR